MANHNYVGHVDCTTAGAPPAHRLRTARPRRGENITAGITYMFGDLATLSTWMFDPAQWP